jgi:hypothetical protein
MRKLTAIVAVGAIFLTLLPAPAHAHGAAGAALALGAFAVFSVLFLPFALLSAAVAAPAPVVYAPPAPVYASPPPVYAAQTYATAPPAISREVVYPHGRYVLYGDGVTVAYRWVWVPNPPPPGSAPVR